MKNKALKLSTLLVAIASMGLVSCGDKSEASSSETVDPSSTYAKVEVPEGITPQVTFWHTFGHNIEAAIKQFGANFKAMVKQKEGIDVEMKFFQYGGYNDTINIVGSNLAIGKGPTMAVAYPDSIATLMVQYDKNINMDPYINHEVYGLGSDGYLGDTIKGESDFISSYLEEGRQFNVSGTYVLPYMKSSEVMLYNLDALKTIIPDYNSDVTEGMVQDYLSDITFDELMSIADYIVKNKAKYGFDDLEYPVYYDSDSNMLISHLEQKKLKFATRGENDSVILNLDSEADPENYAAAYDILDTYRTWHKNGLITTKGVENAYSSDYFKNKKCLFAIGSSGGSGYTFPDEFALGVAKPPYAGDRRDAKYISQGPSIAFFNSKGVSDEQNYYNSVYSWKFYKYITNTVNNVKTCVNNSEGYVPVKKSCYKSGPWQTYLADKDNNYVKVAKVIRNDIEDNFITSLVFNGSATYRTEATALVANVLSTDTDIASLIATAVSKTKLAM